jgi:formiminoglutamase
VSLKIFFDSIPDQDLYSLVSSTKMAAVTSFHTEGFPNWKDADIAIIGVDEYKGENPKTEGSHYLRKSFRQAFYQLAPHSAYKLVDLGNLRIGDSIETTYERLAEVCEVLMTHGTIPVIIGGSHDLDYAQFKAYERLNKHITMLNVDATTDLDVNTSVSSSNHLRHIFAHRPNYLFDYAQIGHQRFFTDKKILDALTLLGYEMKSLGQLRDDFKAVEPIIRESDMMSFDLSAIRRGDAPAVLGGHVFGLTGEEACQLCWYAGLSDRLSSVGFYGFDPSKDEADPLTAELLSVMVWYFVEGFGKRQVEQSFKSSFHIRYTVPMEEQGVELVFYQSKQSGKWWMETGFDGQDDTTHFSRNKIIACGYEDYQLALKGQVPERWIKAVDKH